MYKELDGISTKGLINENENGKDLLETILDNWYSEEIKINCSVLNYNKTYEDNYKEVDEELQKIIGVYEVSTTECLWSDDFMKLLRDYVGDVYYERWYGEEMKKETINWLIEHKVEPTDTKIKDYIFSVYRDNLEKLPTLIRDADFVKGTVLVGKRNIKILKHIKAEFKRLFNKEKYAEFEAEFEQLPFVKFYNTRRESKEKMYLVITNSIASTLGMSSYGNGGVWRSCQNFAEYHDDYAISCFCNLADKGSVVAYITDGKPQDFCGLSKYQHHQMYCRTVIRVLSDNNGKDYLAIDRLYPNVQYANIIYKKIYELSLLTKCGFGIHENLNVSSSETRWDPCTHFLLNKDEDVVVKSKHSIAIIYTTEKPNCNECDNYCRRACKSCSRRCSGCDRDQPFCDNCDSFDFESCRREDCSTCSDNPCRNENKERTHYDDQNRGNNVGGACEDRGTYKYRYTLYHGDSLNKNNLEEKV